MKTTRRSYPSAKILSWAALLGMGSALFSSGAQAATQTWSNSGTNNFNSGAAWLSGTAPGAGDTALFGGTSVVDPVLTSSLSIATLSFTGGTNNYGYTLSSTNNASLTLTGATIITVSASTTTGTNTISSNLILGGAANSTQTINAIRNGTLVLSGNISETNANTKLSFQAASSGVSTNAIITLSGSNSFTGGITFINNAYTLNVNNAYALGTGTIGSTSISINLDNTSGSAITLATNNAFTVGNQITFAGTNDLNLGTGAVTFSGTGFSQAITNSGTALLTIGGVIAETNVGTSLVKAGTGVLSLTGTANTYSGSTGITGGVLQVTKLANGGSNSTIGRSGSAAGNLTIATGTLRYVGGGDTTDRLFSISNGAAAIESSGSGALVFNNTGTMGHIGTLTSTRSLNLIGTNTGTNTIAAVIGNTGSSGGTTSVIKSDAGRWILTGVNTYSGTTIINAGVLEAVDGVGLSTASLLQLRGGVLQSSGAFSRTVGTAAGNVNWGTGSGGFAARGGNLAIQLNGGTASLTWNGSSFVSTGQTLIFGSDSADSMVDFQNGINLGSSGTNTRTITVIDNASSSTDFARISGTISNTTAGQSLQKSGNGLLELTAANTYSGSTIVSAGTLLLSGTLSNTSAVTVASGATLTVNGLINSSATVTSAGLLKGNGTVGGATTITGALSPGNSVGLLTFSNALTLSGNSVTTTMEVVGTSRGAVGGYDAINVGTNQLLTYDGTLTLTMTALVANGTYDLFSFTSGFDAGGFDALSFAGGFYSGTWTESGGTGSGIWTASSGGQSFTFTESTGDLVVSTVPEPSAALLAGAGLAVVLMRLRRSRRV